MRASTRAKTERVDEFLAKGMSITAACEKARIAPQTYRNHSKEIASGQVSAAPKVDIEFLTRIFQSNLHAQDKVTLVQRFF